MLEETQPTAKKARKKSASQISPALIEEVCQRLADNQQVRRTLPGKGRLHIDRQLPFLCVYRRPDDHPDAGTELLVRGEAAYLIAPGDARFAESLEALVRAVVKTLAAEFGAFLIVEIWAAPEAGKATDPAVPTVLPTFTIHGPASSKLTPTIEALERRLRKVKVLKQGVEVEVVRHRVSSPAAMPPLLSRDVARELGCWVLGLAVPPVYRDARSGEVFPILVRSLKRSIGLALRHTYFDFARSRTTHRPAHYHSLGRNAVVKALWTVDRELAAVSNQFDYLLLLTPVNAADAWQQFEDENMEQVPDFHYRPLPVDPAILKRALFRIPIERLEDPVLQSVFQEKRDELESKLTMLRDRDTPRFLYESLQLFGGVEDELLEVAIEILRVKPTGSKKKGAPRAEDKRVDAKSFAAQANAECDFYREQYPEFKGTAKITSRVSGLIVSRGSLLMNSELKLPRSRVAALLAHEVGTHLLTYYNARAQPFRQLSSGLAGYEELQEGLAVFSEYLAGGLSRDRMRQLAGRVVAVRMLTEGASFVETFCALRDEYRFAKRSAYNITMRVYRGGGLTKDAVYLRGLQGVLRYLQKGGKLAPLLVGKIALDHIPIIKELQHRDVVTLAPLTPRHLKDKAGQARLARAREAATTLADLVSKKERSAR